MVSHVQYFFFIPPEFGPVDELGSSFYISPLMPPSLVSHIPVLFYASSYFQQTEKLRHAAESIKNIFSSRVYESLGHVGEKYFKCLGEKYCSIEIQDPSYNNPVLLFSLNSRLFYKYSFTLCMATFTLQPY